MWESAARAAASERPTLRQTTGLSASAHAAQRVDERVRPSHGLEKEPDRSRPGILGEEREVVGGIRHRLGTRRDDAAQPDATAEGQERVGDRSRLAEHGDMTRRRRVLGAPVPGSRPARHEEAHAVRAEERGAELARPRGEPLGRRLRGRTGLGAHARHDERANAGRRRFLERRLDPLVVHHEERALGYLRQLGDARIAAQPCDLVAVRVDAPRRDAARDDGLDRGEVARRRADDGDRTGEEE